MKDRPSISEKFETLIAETKDYMPPTEVGRFVYGSYSRLIAKSSVPGERNPFVRESLNVAIHAAELGLHGRFISGSLLYPAYREQKITEFELKELYEKDEPFIVQILNSLVVLGKFFDAQLPWIRADVPARNSKRPEDTGRKNDFWEKQNIKQSTVAFLALSQNPETAIIKLLERMYLLKNIDQHPEIKGTYLLAKDTIDTYSPVAEALGAWSIKSQLEDVSFKVLNPDMYKSIAEDLRERLDERQARIDRATETVGQAISREGIACQITGRPKHIFGIFNKLEGSGLTLSEVNDILGIRIIVKTEDECYLVLNVLERVFHLAENVYGNGVTYRDWIAHPKPNKYQSIHTTIMFEGHLLEVQIRTQLMHYIAEYGVASHWLYRKAGNSTEEQHKYQEYLEQIAQYRRLYENDKARK